MKIKQINLTKEQGKELKSLLIEAENKLKDYHLGHENLSTYQKLKASYESRCRMMFQELKEYKRFYISQDNSYIEYDASEQNKIVKEELAVA